MAEDFNGANPYVIPRPIVNKGGVRVATIAAAETWTLSYSTVQVINGGTSDRTITLPTLQPGVDGVRFVVRNSGTTNSLILTSAVTLLPGEWAEIASEGTAWTVVAMGITSTPGIIADPGASGAIPATASGDVQIVTAGAETRTLADPKRVGLILTLRMLTDGGDCVLTAASPVNATGNNTLTFAEAGDEIVLISARDGASAYAWHVLQNDGVALSTV